MDWVICDEVSEGLRPSEAQVAVKSIKGRREFLRLSRKLLLERDGHHYLAIGIVYQDPESKAFLIEFPHEADSGANRIWVPERDILNTRPAQVPA
jgi:hypothetical protein